MPAKAEFHLRLTRRLPRRPSISVLGPKPDRKEQQGLRRIWLDRIAMAGPAHFGIPSAGIAARTSNNARRSGHCIPAGSESPHLVGPTNTFSSTTSRYLGSSPPRRKRSRSRSSTHGAQAGKLSLVSSKRIFRWRLESGFAWWISSRFMSRAASARNAALSCTEPALTVRKSRIFRSSRYSSCSKAVGCQV
jgi:hypothetical protein